MQAFAASVANDYRVEAQIGSGGWGLVYRAHDLRHDREVALKVLRVEFSGATSVDRFHREIEILARLHHPNIVAYFDSGEFNGAPWYAMSFIAGETLKDRLAREGQLPIGEALRIAKEVADALAHAHAVRVVHRDIKPGNILLDGDRVCVADFGIARAIDRGAREQWISTSGLQIGTPPYMSPEQAAGEKEIDGRSDIYSLGCVLYEMLVGDPPFTGKSATATAAKHMLDPVPPLETVRSSVPKSVAEVVYRALAKSPADRFPSAAEFSAALEAVARDPAISVAADPHRPRRARHRKLAWSAVALAAMAAAVAPAMWWALNARALARLDPDRVAVVPFNLLGITDTLWRVGMVDILSRNLDGAGPLHAVPPTAVLRSWRGLADASSAATLSQSTGAGLVVFGQIQSSGKDSVQIRASLLDVRAGRIIAQDVETPADETAHIPQLTDSLTVKLLRELGRTRAIAVVPGGSLRSSSFPALKYFLQGEQALRHNDYASAQRWYEGAIALDSGFAMAYHGLRDVRRSVGGNEEDSLARIYGLRAGERNRSLGPRDSLLLVSDSIASTTPRGVLFFDLRTQALLRRRIAALTDVVSRYHDDADAWQELGEARLHNGHRLGIDQQTALEAFERAIAADSGFAPAYFHAVELSLSYRTSDSVRALIRRYLRVRPTDNRFRAVDLMISSRTTDRQRGLELVYAMSPDSALAVAYLLRRWRSSPQAAVTVYLALIANPTQRPDVDTAGAREWLASLYLQRGQLRKARPMVPVDLLELVPMNLVSFGRYGIVPIESTSGIARRWARRPEIELRLAAVTWFGWTRDSVALRTLAAEGRRDLRALPRTASDSIAVVYFHELIRAYLALVEADSATAQLRFRSLPDSLCTWSCAQEVEDAAALLAARGNLHDAAQLLDRHPPANNPWAFIELPWLRQRSSLARALGDSILVARLHRPLQELSLTADSSLGFR